VQPDVIINAAAYTDVDGAEEEVELAEKVNSISPSIIAQAAKEIGSLFIHYSTDYVFSGNNNRPYIETDVPSPLGVYGRSKLLGEQFIASSGCDYLIFRVSWVYSSRRRNFLSTILNLSHGGRVMRIVSDQLGTPTSARLVADVTALCLQTAVMRRRQREFNSGLFHLAAGGCVSRYDFAVLVVKLLKEAGWGGLKVKEVEPVQTSEFPMLAKRPRNSCLCTDKLKREYLIAMPSWCDALEMCLADSFSSGFIDSSW